MTEWLPAALLSLISFGFWGLFTKLTIFHVDSKTALVYQSVGVFIIGLMTLALVHFKPIINAKGIGFGLLTGIAYGIGCLFYFIAADKGKITTVVTLTSLYPFITIFLSYILLSEHISLKQYLGIFFAMIAIYLLST